MNRAELLGLAAPLNVACAWLDQHGPEYRRACRHLNDAVVEIHGVARWTAADLVWMGEVQNDLLERLSQFPV